MTALEILTKFRNQDVNVWLEGERLQYSAATGVLTPDLRAELAAHKEEIARFLRETAGARHIPPPLVPVKREGQPSAGDPIEWCTRRCSAGKQSRRTRAPSRESAHSIRRQWR